MVNLDDQTAFKVFLVWKRMNHGPVLVAIDTSQSRANLHASMVRDDARRQEKLIPEIFVEESKLNHLYGKTIFYFRNQKLQVRFFASKTPKQG